MTTEAKIAEAVAKCDVARRVWAAFNRNDDFNEYVLTLVQLHKALSPVVFPAEIQYTVEKQANGKWGVFLGGGFERMFPTEEEALAYATSQALKEESEGKA